MAEILEKNGLTFQDFWYMKEAVTTPQNQLFIDVYRVTDIEQVLTKELKYRSSSSVFTSIFAHTVDSQMDFTNVF